MNDTVQEQVLKLQQDTDRADPMTKAEFMKLAEEKRKLTPLELRLCATIFAFMRDRKV
jgi:EAL domain-containing protein (putative c-di-GMP-specific phosphodiesterase class I)